MSIIPWWRGQEAAPPREVIVLPLRPALFVSVALDEPTDEFGRVRSGLRDHEKLPVVPHNPDPDHSLHLLVEICEWPHFLFVGDPGWWHKAKHDLQTSVGHNSNDLFALRV